MKKLIQKLKRISFLRKINYKVNYFKMQLRRNNKFKRVEKIISNEYYKKIGRELSWDSPQTYTEKMQFSKLYNFSEEKTVLSDKVLVRNWIEKKIGKNYLIPIVQVYNSFDDIDFELLPDEFVMKCNHDSGSVFICKDKSKINKSELKDKYEFYMKRSLALYHYEIHYGKIEPKIIIEKYMGDNIRDYKFLCFNGVPMYCWVDFDRFNNHKRNIYNMEWELQDFNQYNYGNYESLVDKPKTFEKMKKFSSILSKKFDQVRVDFYEVEGKLYFSEMTFTNGNGFEKIVPDKYDYELGKLWNIDLANREKIRTKRIKDFIK